MTTDQAQLAEMLTFVEAAIRDAQTFAHEHGLANRQTRKLPGDMLRTLHRWQSANGAAAPSATMWDKSRATGPEKQRAANGRR